MTVAAAVRQFGPAYGARFGATMPAGHRRALDDLAASLQTLAADPHYFGGTVGMLAVLHT